MVKVIVLLPRRADMSPEAFKQHLRETHLPLVTRLPGLRRLILNWVLPDPNEPRRPMTPSPRTGSMTRRRWAPSSPRPRGRRSPPTCRTSWTRAGSRSWSWRRRTFPCRQDPPRPPPAEASPETVPSRFSPSLGPLILAGLDITDDLNNTDRADLGALKGGGWPTTDLDHQAASVRSTRSSELGSPAQILATAAPHRTPWLPEGYGQNYRQPLRVRLL
jgi:EthD domain